MHGLTDMPIKRKLTLVLLLTSMAVLTLAGMALVCTELVTFRQGMVRDVNTLASVLGQNSSAALVFGDEVAAGRTLASLRAEPDVVAAAVYLPNGARLAEYVRDRGSGELPERPGSDDYHFTSKDLQLFHGVELNGARIGTVYIRADLSKMTARLRVYTMIVGLVLVGSAAATLVIAPRVRRPIVEPILALAGIARYVTERKDYSVRAPRRGGGGEEISLLTDAFNQMLTDIERGQASLRQSNDELRAQVAERLKAEARLNEYQEHLEAMVARRTAELAKANEELAQTASAEHQARLDAQRAHEALQAAQGRMIQADKLAALGQLVAGVAHEINNPLAFVTNDVAVMQRSLPELQKLFALYRSAEPCIRQADPALADELAGLCDRCDVDYTLGNMPASLNRQREGLNRIQQIVRDLREFARQDAIGELSEAADINAGIESTLNIVRGRAKKLDVELDVELAPLPPVACAPARINQVILNLIVNAIDACNEHGKVSVRTRTAPNGIEIEVEDDGCGIPREVVGRIFDPFFTTKPQGQGTGLGLSISHGIVSDHGGEISVQSEPGHGARFTVRLPLRPPPPPTTSRNGAAPAATGTPAGAGPHGTPREMSVAASGGEGAVRNGPLVN